MIKSVKSILCTLNIIKNKLNIYIYIYFHTTAEICIHKKLQNADISIIYDFCLQTMVYTSLDQTKYFTFYFKIKSIVKILDNLI